MLHTSTSTSVEINKRLSSNNGLAKNRNRTMNEFRKRCVQSHKTALFARRCACNQTSKKQKLNIYFQHWTWTNGVGILFSSSVFASKRMREKERESKRKGERESVFYLLQEWNACIAVYMYIVYVSGAEYSAGFFFCICIRPNLREKRLMPLLVVWCGG